MDRQGESPMAEWSVAEVKDWVEKQAIGGDPKGMARKFYDEEMDGEALVIQGVQSLTSLVGKHGLASKLYSRIQVALAKERFGAVTDLADFDTGFGGISWGSPASTHRRRHRTSTSASETSDASQLLGDAAAADQGRAFESHFDMLKYMNEQHDLNDAMVRNRLLGRYGNTMIVATLVFTVAAQGLLDPYGSIIDAGQSAKDVYGVFMSISFACTLASTICSAVLVGAINVMPQFLSSWYYKRTVSLQKASWILIVMGCVSLWIAVDAATTITLGPTSGTVLLIVMTSFIMPPLASWASIMLTSRQLIKEEYDIRAPHF